MPNWCANELYVTYAGTSDCPSVQNRALKRFFKDHLNPDQPGIPLNLWKYNDKLKSMVEEHSPDKLFACMGGFWGGTNWSRADFGYRGPDDIFGACNPNVNYLTFERDGDPRDGKQTLLYQFNIPWSPFSFDVLAVLKSYYPDLEFELVYAEKIGGFFGRYWTDSEKNQGNTLWVGDEGGRPNSNSLIGVDDDGNPVDHPDDATEWILPNKYKLYQDVWSASG